MANHLFSMMLVVLVTMMEVYITATTLSESKQFRSSEDLFNVSPIVTYNTQIATQNRTHDLQEALIGCDFIKGCVTNADDASRCLERNACLMVVSFGKALGESPEKDEAVIEMFGRSTKWIAIGLSDDKFMGNELVIECVYEDPIVNLYLSWNSAQLKKCDPGKECRTNKRLINSTEGVVRLVKAFLVGKEMYCKFFVKVKFERHNPEEAISQRFDLIGNSYYVLMATGASVVGQGPAGGIAYHSLTRYVGKKVFLGRRLSPTLLQMKYFKIHGICMIVAWLFCFPTGSFVARYMQNTLVNTRFCGVVLWKFMHVVLVGSGFILNGAGVALYILGKQGWDATHKTQLHAYGGVTIISILIAVTVMGLFTKERLHRSEKQKSYNIAHSVLGHFAYLISYILSLLTPQVTFSDVPCSFQVIVMSWIVAYIFMHFVMTYHYFWVSFIDGTNKHRSNREAHPFFLQVAAADTTESTRSVAPSSAATEEDMQTGLEKRRLTSRVSQLSGESTMASSTNNVNTTDLHKAYELMQTEKYESPDSPQIGFAVAIFIIVNFIHVACLIVRMLNGNPCYSLADYVLFFRESVT